jgi:hypothetical protein
MIGCADDPAILSAIVSEIAVAENQPLSWPAWGTLVNRSGRAAEWLHARRSWEACNANLMPKLQSGRPVAICQERHAPASKDASTSVSPSVSPLHRVAATHHRGEFGAAQRKPNCAKNGEQFEMRCRYDASTEPC